LSDFVSAENVNYMINKARGLLCSPMSSEYAKRLGLPLMSKSHDAFSTAFTISTDAKTTSTGISAYDRADTIKQLADLTSTKADFYHPGHVFPLIAETNGVLKRAGHTEAAIDLAKIANANPSAYICEIVKKDGRMARYKDLKAFSEGSGLTLITIEDIIQYRHVMDRNLLKEVSNVDLPTKYGHFKMRSYLDINDKPVLLIYKGNLQEQTPLLLRIHSECFTGDVLGSNRCDCGEQLGKSLEKIESVGRGAVVYLAQEGRGIGLINKLKAYELQEKGLDTVEANLKLGFEADQRNYGMAVNLLNKLNISQVELMTNNPDKIHQLEEMGTKVTKRVPLEVEPNVSDIRYLETKKKSYIIY
jgi:GTP cyclohydrolase II